ncbi:MAG TPA: uridine kinase [Cytophagaceae bacterium]|jgi:uridine kinase|nr:uridine kinase [Cytophagaceae bacterium]
MNKQPYVIGICGGSSSGKTLFISRLKELFSKEQVCVISQDEYYKEKKVQVVDEKGIENFDLPTAIDADTFQTDLQKLMKGETVYKLEYTFNNPLLVPKMLEYKPAPVLIVEGIFIFHYEKIYSLIDFSIFIHTKKDLKLDRRIKRDAVERGYDLEHVLYTQKNHVQPAYQKFIKPFRHEADIVIPNNERGFDKALELVAILIKSKF